MQATSYYSFARESERIFLGGLKWLSSATIVAYFDSYYCMRYYCLGVRLGQLSRSSELKKVSSTTTTVLGSIFVSLSHTYPNTPTISLSTLYLDLVEDLKHLESSG